MNRIVFVAIIAAVLGFVAVYASLTLRGNGELASDSTNETKSKKLSGERLRAYIAHKSPKDLPSFEFTDGDGKTRTLQDWKGKVVVLNLWATWCAPCREEMPSLDNLKKYFNHENFDVLAISMDRGGLAKPRKFYEEERLKNLELYIDPTTKLMFKLKTVGLPATLVIDKEGREIGRLTGPAQWDSSRAIEIIKKALTSGQ